MSTHADDATEQHATTPGWAELCARVLGRIYGRIDGLQLIEAMVRDEFRGRIAVVSSFGAESAVLLDLVASIDRATPVIFLDTEKHFGETLRYRDHLIGHLGLSDVRSVRPDPAAVTAGDADGMLWRTDPDSCCHLRKVLPLKRALHGFDAWISGRKRFQGASRSAIKTIEAEGGRVKINPLAGWSAEDIQREVDTRNLPVHPLLADGFMSIGCMPCTDKARPGEDPRAGRWRGRAKTECGIHGGIENR